MMAERKRQSLGRGLDALLGTETKASVGSDRLKGSRLIAVERLHPGRNQPRHSIDEELIEELAQSIRENGIIQPLLVRQHPDDQDAYEIIAGERRWRAAQMAKVHQVPVIIRDLNDQQALEIGLVENLQRQDLSPLDEAIGYQRLIDEFAHTQYVLAKTVGKSRPHIANTLRLLGLPDPVKKMLDANELSAGHARALLNAPDPLASAREVTKKGLSVRQTERLVKKNQRRKDSPSKPEKKDVDTLALERDLANLLGLKVAIKFKGNGGSLTVNYDSLEQLDDILLRLGHGGGGSGAPAPDTTPKEPALKKKEAKNTPKKKSPKLLIGLKSSSKGK